jgi:hypothetical protein
MKKEKVLSFYGKYLIAFHHSGLTKNTIIDTNENAQTV